jgi:hypothetical protein
MNNGTYTHPSSVQGRIDRYNRIANMALRAGNLKTYNAYLTRLEALYVERDALYGNNA